MNRIKFISSSSKLDNSKHNTLENTSSLYTSRQEAITLLQSETIEKEFLKEISKSKEKVYALVDSFFSSIAKEKLKEISEEKSFLFSIIGTSSEEEVDQVFVFSLTKDPKQNPKSRVQNFLQRKFDSEARRRFFEADKCEESLQSIFTRFKILKEIARYPR